MTCTSLIHDTSRYDRYLDRAQNKDKYYISTGFPELDRMIGGIDIQNENKQFCIDKILYYSKETLLNKLREYVDEEQMSKEGFEYINLLHDYFILEKDSIVSYEDSYFYFLAILRIIAFSPSGNGIVRPSDISSLPVYFFVSMMPSKSEISYSASS